MSFEAYFDDSVYMFVHVHVFIHRWMNYYLTVWSIKYVKISSVETVERGMFKRWQVYSLEEEGDLLLPTT